MSDATCRVLHVLPHAGGGGERYVDELAGICGFSQERIYLSSGRTIATAARSLPIQAAKAWHRRNSVDIVHLHGDVASMIATTLVPGARTIMTTHGLHLLRRTTGPTREVAAYRMRKVTCRVAEVICTSETERQELLDIVAPGVADNLQVIHNGVAQPLAGQPGERSDTRRRLGIDEDAIVVLFVGQLEPRKAPHEAINAVKQARGIDPRIVLLMVGEGPLASALAAEASAEVQLLGFRTDVPVLMEAADVFLQTSRREGMSFALLEAMARGMAVVSSDGPGNREALDDSGILCEDDQALASGLVTLASDSDRRAELGTAASMRVATHFAVRDMVQKTAGVYERILLRNRERIDSEVEYGN